MRTFTAIFISIIFFSMESTILKGFEIRGITPNLLIILVVTYGILRGSKIGGAVGFIVGALQDIFFYPVFGFQTLLFFYFGILAGFFNKDFYKENYVLPVILITFADFFYGFLVYVFTYLMRGRLDILYYLRNIIIPEIIYTLLVGIFIYKILLYIDQKLEYYSRKTYNRIKSR